MSDTDWFHEPRHIDEWNEDHGAALWWTSPITEPPYLGTPNDDNWPGHHKWWTPLPDHNAINERLKLLSGERRDD